MLIAPRLAAHVLIASAVLTWTAGCTVRDSNRWEPEPEPETPVAAAPATAPTTAPALAAPTAPAPTYAPLPEHAILFAPLGIAPLAKINPQARDAWAEALAQRVDRLAETPAYLGSVDGLYSRTIPASDDAAWTKGRVQQTAGADLVALTVVTSVTARDDGPGPHGRRRVFTAQAELRALDGQGNVVFHKTASGEAPDEQSPKMMAADHRPECVAAFDACSRLARALVEFAANRPKKLLGDIAVSVATTPPGAEVLVDGIFRGTSPCVLALTGKPVVVRLLLTGYQPWERTVQPSADMRIQPVLVPESARPASAAP